jgi:hypothetical protein
MVNLIIMEGEEAIMREVYPGRIKATEVSVAVEEK